MLIVFEEVFRDSGGALLGDTSPRVRLNFDPIFNVRPYDRPYSNGSGLQCVYFDQGKVDPRDPDSLEPSSRPALLLPGDGLNPPA